MTEEEREEIRRAALKVLEDWSREWAQSVVQWIAEESFKRETE